MTFFNRAPAAVAEPIESTDELLPPEELADRRRRRMLWFALPLLAALAVGVFFSARPALHLVKAWQSRRAALEAERLTDEGNIFAAKTKVQDALLLWRDEPEAIRAAALFLTHIGETRAAVPFWKQLERVRPLTAAEERDFANGYLSIGKVDLADLHLHKAWPAGKEGVPADWILGMQIALRANRFPEAAKLSRRVLADKAVTTRQRFTAALGLIYSGEPASQAAGWQEMDRIAHEDTSAESLDALVLLTRQITQAKGGTGPAPALSREPLEGLIERIEGHPLAKIQHRLMALDSRISQDPAKRPELIQSAIDRYGKSTDDAEIAALAAWLYGKGEFERVLDVIPPARATERGLLFQRFDALGALDRWQDIREAIRSGKVVIDPVIEQMYLARCADKLGEPKVRDARWEAALDAAGSNPDKLLEVGQYAAKTGTADVAERAFRAVLKISPDSPETYAEMGRLFEASGQTRKLLAAFQTLQTLKPQDTSIRNNVLYLDALLNEKVTAARDGARELIRGEPANLAMRGTLGLAELRMGDSLGALDAFKGIGPNSGALGFRSSAVYAAALWDASYNREAREIARAVNVDQLLPEERLLIQPILDSKPDVQPAR